MKTIFQISFLLLIVAISLSSCTRNDGDIGHWFGTWELRSIIVDGEPEQRYSHDILWKFQSDLFSMMRISLNPNDHSYSQVWGSWAEADNALIISFGDTDDEFHSPGVGVYAPFDDTLLNPIGESRLKIISQKGNDATLEYLSPQGNSIQYILHKQ